MLTLTLVGCIASRTMSMIDDDIQSALAEIEKLRTQNEQIVAANAALAAKVDQLEQRVVNDGDWLTEQRSEEIRAIVSDVLSDSSTRDSLAADGAVAGWDKTKGFFLASSDGNYLLRFRGDAQLRWEYNARDIGAASAASGSPSNSTEPREWGFENRRVNIVFEGNVIDPSWHYQISLVAGRFAVDGNNVALNVCFIEKDLGSGFKLRAGQFKGPFLREESVSHTAQLAIDASLMSEFFGIVRNQGLQLTWSDEKFRVHAFYGDELRARGVDVYSRNSDGDLVPFNAGPAGTVPTAQNTTFTQDQSDYAFSGRMEWMPSGQWKQFKDFSSYRGESVGVLFGVGAYAQQLDAVSNTDGATPNTMWSATADVSFEFGGATLFAAGIVREVDLQEAQPTRDGGSAESLSQWGTVIQGSVFVSDDVEVYTRYELGNSDTDRYRVSANSLLANGEDINLLTLGLNWWPNGPSNQQIKITTDVGYSVDPLIDFAALGAGYLVDYTEADGTSSNGQWVMRSQLQFLF